MGITKIKRELNKYLAKIKKDIPVNGAILYGSYAKGTAGRNSDIDLIVLSDKFNKMSDDARSKFLYRRSVGFPYNLHVYGLTSAEYQNANALSTLGAIKKEGLSLSL